MRHFEELQAMMIVHRITLVLLIVGGLNWGLIALGGYDVDVIAGIFGGEDGVAARVIYGLVGLSALYQLGPSVRVLRGQQGSASDPMP